MHQKSLYHRLKGSLHALRIPDIAILSKKNRRLEITWNVWGERIEGYQVVFLGQPEYRGLPPLFESQHAQAHLDTLFF